MDATMMTAVTLGAVILGAVVNIVGLIGKREAHAATEATRDVKLDHIVTKIDNIERCQVSLDKILQSHENRLVGVERDIKHLGIQVDELRNEERRSAQND